MSESTHQRIDITGQRFGALVAEEYLSNRKWRCILTPRFYWQAKGIQRAGKPTKYGPCHWNSSTVTKILTLQEYCGDVLNFKTHSKSYKNKRRIENDRENWAIFKDAHEAIIDRATWEKIQERRGKVRKRRTHEGEKHMFSGLLVCADCGSNLHFHFNQGNPEMRSFSRMDHSMGQRLF